MPGTDERALELLRQQSGLSIDLEGRLCHRGEPITHGRTLEVLWGSLTRQPDGRYLVRVGRESGYVQVADVPYAVRGVVMDRGWPLLRLGDGSLDRLDPATLAVDAAGVLRCRVKGGEHPARFTRQAQLDLGLMLEEAPGAAGFELRLGGRRYPVRCQRGEG